LAGRIIGLQQRFGQALAVGQLTMIQRVAQQFGKAGFTRPEEFGDQAGGQIAAARLFELLGQIASQMHERLVNALTGSVLTRVAGLESARDDVFGHLGQQFLWALFVKLDDRRNIPGDIGSEDFLNFHGPPNGTFRQNRFGEDNPGRRAFRP